MFQILTMDADTESESSVLETFKSTLKKFLLNQIDQFQVMNMSRRFSVDISNIRSFSQQKYMIQRVVIEQILRSNLVENRDYYERILDETKQNIAFQVPRKYECSLIGCLYRGDTHRDYLQHMKRIHSNYESYSCNHNHVCALQFSSLPLLLDHVKSSHTRSNERRNPPRVLVSRVVCKCTLIGCSGKTFNSVEDLSSHIVNYHSEEHRECIFSECTYKFKPGKTDSARRHVRIQHKNKDALLVKQKYLVSGPDRVTGDHMSVVAQDSLPEEQARIECDYSVEENQELYCEDDLTQLFNDNHAPIVNVEDFPYFKMQYADFLNRMSHFKFLPYRTVHTISLEYLDNYIKANDAKKSKLISSLKKIPDLSEEQIGAVVSDTFGEDEFMQAQIDLNTEYKLTKYIQEHFQYIAPVEIVLNKDEVVRGKPKDVVHYVPICESFKALIQDKSLNEVWRSHREKNNLQEDDVLTDLLDGTQFEDNTFFKNNPGAYAAHFYSDSIEVSNPLGAAKGKHKVNQVFYTLAQIPSDQRSRIDRMQLCLVFKDKLIKKYGYRVIFKKLIEDLKLLEDGIMIYSPVTREVKMGVLVYSADSLEAHSLGGFSGSFSSKDICRFCHATHSELQDHIHDFDGEQPFSDWTQEEYDHIVSQFDSEDVDLEVDANIDEMNLFTEEEQADVMIEDDAAREMECHEENVVTLNDGKFGLKHMCPLNELQSFHAVTGLPPDCMHDLMEGVVAQVNILIL